MPPAKSDARSSSCSAHQHTMNASRSAVRNWTSPMRQTRAPGGGGVGAGGDNKCGRLYRGGRLREPTGQSLCSERARPAQPGRGGAPGWCPPRAHFYRLCFRRQVTFPVPGMEPDQPLVRIWPFQIGRRTGGSLLAARGGRRPSLVGLRPARFQYGEDGPAPRRCSRPTAFCRRPTWLPDFCRRACRDARPVGRFAHARHFPCD